MKIVVQRVLSACVEVDNKVVGRIDQGLLLYVCFEANDTLEMVSQATDKIAKLRIFNDSDQKMNLSVKDIQGSILSISQFTLSWDGKKGHRPSFDRSMPPNQAKIFYRQFNDQLAEKDVPVEKGLFGAEMKVDAINDGPVTFFLEY